MVEIEKKFILANLPIPIIDITKPGSLITTVNITQYYKEGWRYRREITADGEKSYFRMKKILVSANAGVSEETTPEPVEMYEWLDGMSVTPYISKHRHIYSYYGGSADDDKYGVKLHVDVFLRIKLIMLEVELPELSYEPIIPKNIQKEIIAEVTGNLNFSNSNLIHHVRL